MVKISSFLMALAIFLTFILSCSFTIVSSYASGVGFVVGGVVLDIASNAIYDFFKSVISDNPSIDLKIEACRYYYFCKLLNNDYNYDGDLISSNGYQFDDAYLRDMYRYYVRAIDSSHLNEYDSKGDIYLQAAGYSDDWNLFGISFGHGIFGDFVSNQTEFINYFNTLLARYALSQGSSSITDPNPGKTGLEISPGYVSGSDFKESLEKDNLSYTVKTPCIKMGYRNCDWYQNYYPVLSYGNTAYFYKFPLMENYEFLTKTPECYVLIYYYNGTDYYLSKYQFHFTLSSEDIWFDDRDEIDHTNYSLFYECWNNIDSDQGSINLDPDIYDITSHPYVVFQPDNLYAFGWYSNRTDYFQNKNMSNVYLKNFKPNGSVFLDELVSPDLTKSLVNLYYGISRHFVNVYSEHDKTCAYKGYCDFGILLSGTPILTEYDLDIDKFPDDCVIEVNGGDTVYNYNITNPSTGQSSTVNEYVTNNYTYIEESSGGQGSGGSVSGDVNVHGDVGVNGNIDVNVNVNQGGTGIDPNDVITGDVDLGKYYDTAVEQTNGLNKFLTEFFSFLPNDILLLLGVTVAAAFICRLLGR